MKSKIHLLIILIAFCTYSTYGQITTTIDEVYINGQTGVTNCGTIDFETTENNTLTFYYTLTKTPSSTGEGYLKIRLKYNSSSNGAERGLQYITSQKFGSSNEYSHTIATNIDASEVQVSGSSIYLEFTEVSSPYVYYNSCEYPIIKTPVPSFSLSPNNTTVSCGSSSPVTFTVTPSNIPSGSSVTYQWSVGNGWLRNGNPASYFTTTTASIILVPNAYPPSNVNVTPVLNGSSYPQLTSNVNLANFNTFYSITGNNSLCSTSTYSVNNLPSGISVTSWSVSDSNIATIVGSGNQAVLTAERNGVIAINATLTNSCGQRVVISKSSITVGSPTVTSHTIKGGSDNVSRYATSVLRVNYAIGATKYYWSVTPNTSCSAGSGPTINNTSSNTYTSRSRSVIINWNVCPGNYAVVCYAKNSCGLSYIDTKWVQVFGPNNNPCDDGWSLQVNANPINGNSVTGKIIAPVDPCNNNFRPLKRQENIINVVRISTLSGKTVYKNTFKSNEFSINGLNLASGQYILNVTSPDEEMLSKIIIVK